MLQLPPELANRILLFLSNFELARIASMSTRFKGLSLTETEYVRRVKELFVTTAPTFSGKHLLNSRKFGLLLAGTPQASASYWFL
jgi:hypothetical protein